MDNPCIKEWHFILHQTYERIRQVRFVIFPIYAIITIHSRFPVFTLFSFILASFNSIILYATPFLCPLPFLPSIFRLPEWLNQMIQTISLLCSPPLLPSSSPPLLSLPLLPTFTILHANTCLLFSIFCCSILPTGKSGERL